MTDWNPRRPKVPVDVNGNWQSYPSYGHKSWEEVTEPFYAELEIKSMYSGRSAKGAILVDSEGKEYPMFIADLLKGIREGTMEVKTVNRAGILTGWWFPSKRGANYGIRTVKHEGIVSDGSGNIG